jgi:hypothetical protein
MIQVVIRQFIFYANSILERSDIPHSSGLSGSEIPICREQLPFSMRKYEDKLDASKLTVIDEATLTTFITNLELQRKLAQIAIAHT